MALERNRERIANWRQTIPWTLADVLLVLILPIFVPLFLVVTISIWGQLGILPSWVQLIRGESALSIAIRYVMSLVIDIGIVVFLFRKRRVSIEGLGFKKVEPIWYLKALGIYLGQVALIICIFTVLNALLPGIDTKEEQSIFDMGRSGWGWWLTAFGAIVFAPIIEEILFRGILFAGMAKRWPIWLATILSSLAFAVLHGQVNVGIYTFVLGILLSWLYLRSGSLYLPIFVHFINNLVAFWLLTQS